MSGSKSKIDYKFVDVNQLIIPQITDVGLPSQSITPYLGSLSQNSAEPGKLYLGDGTSWNAVGGGGGGGITIGGIEVATDTNALRLGGSILHAQIADGTHPGIVSTNAQFFAGEKDFNDSLRTHRVNMFFDDLNTIVGYSNNLSNGGNGNVIMGKNAFKNNTVGAYNVCIGDETLYSSTACDGCTAIGDHALRTISTGIAGAVAVGYQSLMANTTGAANTAVGGSSLTSNISGSNNTAVGYQALIANTTGSGNTALGLSLSSNTSGSNNTVVGYQTLNANTIGSGNTCVGYRAMLSATGPLSENTAIGYQAMQGTKTYLSCIAIGNNALDCSTTGTLTGTVAIGTDTLTNLTDGANNTAIGYRALNANTTGDNNTVVGYQALNANTTGSSNNALGYQALNANTTGGDNISIGYQNMLVNTTGNANICIGNYCGDGMTTGSNNTIIGSNAGELLTTGSTNIFLGKDAGNLVSGAHFGNICIGSQGAVADNCIYIGNTVSAVKNIQAGIRGVTIQPSGIAVLIDANHQLGTVASSRVLKDGIEPMTSIIQKIKQVVPSSFHFKSDESKTKTYGFIAEDFANVFPELVVDIPDSILYPGEKLKTIQYHILPTVALKAIKEQQAMIEYLQANILVMQGQINTLLGI